MEGIPDRNLVCLGGLPFDAVGMDEAVDRVCAAAKTRQPLFVSTPNLNFMIAAQHDAAFRDSVVHSDLSIVDGMPLVWMARLLGLPVRERVPGSGLFEALRAGAGSAKLGRPLTVYFFGGPVGVAARACARINEWGTAMRCVGFHCPGFGSVADMSGQAVIDEINASGADFLVVSLGAKKGQAWIEYNRGRLAVPVISHLGAVVNFVAGTVNRAPVSWQRWGLEWLWRIKEEPALVKRYAADGWQLLAMVVGRVLPYALWLRRHPAPATDGTVTVARSGDDARIVVDGALTGTALAALGKEVAERRDSPGRVVVDLAGCSYLGSGFFGIAAACESRGGRLEFAGVPAQQRRLFDWNGLGFLLAKR